MKKTIRWSKRVFALFLTVMLAIPVYAQEPRAVVHLKNNQDFLAFAELCRLDSYSRDLEVYLDYDPDFSGLDFGGIPVFCGTFYGNHHKVSGWELKVSGSNQGFFRYLEENARVQDLTIEGSVQPEGSRSGAGGIAGCNRGTVANCSFHGCVSGNQQIGGIAGVNELTGVIENCQVKGKIHGNHFVGGIAGQNRGVIRSCTSSAMVNTTVQENDVELSDITMDTLLGTESAATVTDIAGIAGASWGVIRECTNQGDVGYAHMGYNIGGIAGTQSGYIADCKNTGTISGRKEVGGIVGQMEPILRISYAEDTLQILQQQLDNTSALVNRASGNAMHNGEHVGEQMNLMKDQLHTAQEAVSQLLPSKENPELPDQDAIAAAQNALTGSMQEIHNSMTEISDASRDSLQTASRDLEQISDSIRAMGSTLSNASEQMGGSIADVSYEDTPENRTGKVENCTNSGEIFGDMNAGGIGGAIGIERDLDGEDDHLTQGKPSLNFHSELRSVITNCTNLGSITGKKRNIGGITGQMTMGLARNCVNLGMISGGEGSYIGGIVGTGTGYIETCASKCELEGKTHVGGIAGSCTRAIGCLSVADIRNGTEKLGAVLGERQACDEENPVADNHYLPAPVDLGGIDGISYENAAAPVSSQDFFAMKQLPEAFVKSIVTFRQEDGREQTFKTITGGGVPVHTVPEVTYKAGFRGHWQGLESKQLEHVYFDRTYQAEYTPCSMAVASKEIRTQELPVMLAEGEFPDETPLVLTPYQEKPPLDQGETWVEGWKIPRPKDAAVERLRLCIPDDVDVKQAQIWILRGDGSWSQADVETDKSYLVFPVQTEDTAVCLILAQEKPMWILYVGIAGLFFLILMGIMLRKKYKKNKSRKKEVNTESEK